MVYLLCYFIAFFVIGFIYFVLYVVDVLYLTRSRTVLLLYLQIYNSQNRIQKWKVDNFRSSHPEVFFGKRCSENMQQIYRRTPMAKSNFKKVVLLCNIIEITLQHEIDCCHVLVSLLLFHTFSYFTQIELNCCNTLLAFLPL